MERAKLAWPFVRDGYTKLVQTSLDAKEAVHPVPPSRPAVGKGLPGARSAYRSVRADRNAWVVAQGRGDRVGAYRSTDGGLTFKAWPTEWSTRSAIAVRSTPTAAASRSKQPGRLVHHGELDCHRP